MLKITSSTVDRPVLRKSKGPAYHYGETAVTIVYIVICSKNIYENKHNINLI